MNAEILKRTLSNKLEEITDIVNECLAQNGVTSDECQRMNIINQLLSVDSAINGIEDGDIKPELFTNTAYNVAWFQDEEAKETLLSINGEVINELVFTHSMTPWEPLDKESYIAELTQKAISLPNNSDARVELEKLESDDFNFDEIVLKHTLDNEFISPNTNPELFDEACAAILLANKQLSEQ